MLSVKHHSNNRVPNNVPVGLQKQQTNSIRGILEDAFAREHEQPLHLSTGLEETYS